MSNGISIVSEFSGQEWTTDLLVEPPSLATSVSSSSPVLLNDIEDLSTWLQLASPASHFQQQEASLAPMTLETCGLPQRNVFAWYSHNTHCWKTFQPSLIADISDEFLVTWPKWGSMHDGECSALAPLVRHIHGKDCSFWRTPTASEATGGGSARQAELAQRGEKRKSGHGIALKTIDLFKLRYGMNPPPKFYEWLMGIPIGATGLKPLGMDGFRLWLQQHGKC
jgi:hypothetical protein